MLRMANCPASMVEDNVRANARISRAQHLARCGMGRVHCATQAHNVRVTQRTRDAARW